MTALQQGISDQLNAQELTDGEEGGEGGGGAGDGGGTGGGERGGDQVIVSRVLGAVEGNSVCADCRARGPTWARFFLRFILYFIYFVDFILLIYFNYFFHLFSSSPPSINLGILVCMECSGVHRRLGTHLSKVRSLTLDKWEPELLLFMKSVGNTRSNRVFEGGYDVELGLKANENTSREGNSIIIYR